MTIRSRLRACLVVFASIAFSCAVAAQDSAPANAKSKPNTTTVTESVLYSFCSLSNCSDGTGPYSIVQASDGNFYGIANRGGGVSGSVGGTFYKLTPGGTLTVLYGFCSTYFGCPYGSDSFGIVQGGDGNFYGTTSSEPVSVFKATPTGAMTTLYNFCSYGSGCSAGPISNVIEGSDGNFYGTTDFYGEDQPSGAAYYVTPSGDFNVLFNLGTSIEGLATEGTLVQGSDGNYYGTTYGGGIANSCGGTNDTCGTIYKVTPAGVLTTLYEFCAVSGCPDGENPTVGLIEGANGNFYGVTDEGGADNGGTIFEITPAGGFTTLHSFCSQTACADGEAPNSLLFGSDGNLYGTTAVGGANHNAGTVFQLTPGNAYTVLYNFCSQGGTDCTDGQSPQVGLLQGNDGNFYGTTFYGGANQDGVVFKLTGSPTMAGPVQLSLSNSSVESGDAVTLSWKVVNAFSTTMQQCYAFVQGGYAAAGTWTGLQSGTMSNGVYSGSAQVTPTEGGIYTYALTCGGVESGYATLTVNGGTLAVTTSSLPGGIVNVPYTQTLVAQGGTPPYTWSLSSGSLPAGLTLNASTGIISGTPTTPAMNPIVVKVTDSESTASTATASLSITVAPVFAITTTSLPNPTIGTAYSASVTVVGGLAPYIWGISDVGYMPAGLSLNTATGAITGTPASTDPVEKYSFTIYAGDSESPRDSLSIGLTMVLNPGPLQITTTSLPSDRIGVAYSAGLAATGGIAPYTWNVSSGSLPAGLTLGEDGYFSGTPTTLGTSSFVVTVKDSESTPATASAPLSLTIIPSTLVFTPTSLPVATQGLAYSETLAASGGATPYTWSIVVGSLPAGLSIGPSTGTISGVPTAVGTDTFTIEVQDAENPPQTLTNVFNTTVDPDLEVNSAALPSGTADTSYSTTLAAQGGTPPYLWNLSSGNLPAGLSLAAATGVISGTPMTAATSSFAVTVTDSLSYTATAAFSITINPEELVITTPVLATGAVGTSYANQLVAGGGTAPYKWSINSGSLPAGLSLSTSTGVISGKPTGVGTSDFTVKVTDSASHSVTSSQSITVNAAATVRITTTNLPGAITGTAYSATLAATSGTAPYTWSIRSGSLPFGLSLASSTGVISGTPTVAGTTSFIAQVTDSASGIATASLSITVSQALQVSTVVLPTAAEGTAYIANLIAVGGPSVRKWSVNSGSLPAGLTLNASTGAILGTPTATGTSSFIIQVAAGGYTATTNLSITVNASSAVRITTSGLPSGTVGTSYAGTMAATGGTSPYTWSVYSGSLPPGLTLNTGTGVISGTPTTAGTWNFLVQVADSGNNSATASLSITVAP